MADSLSNYDAATGGVYGQGDYYTDYFKQILSLLDQMTDMTIFKDTSYVTGTKFTNKPLPALTKDSVKMRTLFNKVFDFRMITSSYSENNLQPQLELATRLIVFLKKEYHIND